MSEAADYASGFFNSFFDILEDAYYGIGKFFGFYDNSKEENIKKTQEALLQYNDVTRRQVRNIKRRIYDADDRYCERLMLVKDFLHELEEYICVFRDAMINYQYQPTLFDISEIDFQSKYFAMLEAYNNVLVMNTVTDADVEAFINSEAAAEFMNEQVQIIYDYIADLSQIEITDYDFWKLVIFQMFDITEGQIASGGEYDQLIMKKELTEMLDELAGCYVYSDSDEQAALDSVEAVIKEAKKQGKNIYEFLNSIRGKDGKLILDGRTKSAKKFLKFLNGLDNLQDILKYGDQALEILTKLFIDYDKNLAFLDSFEKNANLSEDMMACFSELRATYEHELSQTLKDVGRQIVENGVDALYSISIGKTVGMVKEAIGLVGEVTGENAKTGARLEILTYGYDLVSSSRSAFLESMRKLKVADANDENYPALMADFKNCFSLYKSSLKRMFEKMAVAADSPQKDYYYYCSSEVSSMTLKEYTNPDFMSYEEYLKDGYAF